MDTKEYRMEIKVKNNLLYKKIYDTYGSVDNFCNNVGLSQYIVLGFLNFKYDLYNKRDGKLRNSVKKLMEIFNCPLTELFPENYKCVETNKHIREVSQKEIEMISMDNPEVNMLTYTSDISIEQKELKDRMEKVLATLTPREVEVIKAKYLDDCTYKEIGKRLGVCGTRIKQIAEKAIRKMKHPSRVRLLGDYVTNSPISTISELRNYELMLWDLIKHILINVFDIENQIYKIDDKCGVRFTFKINTYGVAERFGSLWTEAKYAYCKGYKTMVHRLHWPYPIKVSLYDDKYLKIACDRKCYANDEQINTLFRRLISIFFDLCKSSSNAEITKDYVIISKKEFGRLKSKLDEFLAIMNINV